eukprot:1159145-Pelagomonas_calceolata.AAC.27
MASTRTLSCAAQQQHTLLRTPAFKLTPALYRMHSRVRVGAEALEWHRLRLHHSHLSPMVGQRIAQGQPAQPTTGRQQARQHLHPRHHQCVIFTIISSPISSSAAAAAHCAGTAGTAHYWQVESKPIPAYTSAAAQVL